MSGPTGKEASFGSPGNDHTVLEPGINYVCQRCTACCKWPGDVRIDDADVTKISKYLGMDELDFLGQYTRLRTNRQGLSLLEKTNHECIMLEGNACRIHEVKPSQCAGFPNKWNFPNWRDFCEAIPVPVSTI
ncbi:YkgJ family cysteine cluster protein [Luteolibacter algae]|uniref:YkgJ family cysteine cluster protein n=1 Tax=Luteolibacter algae TaxID=454151 RepID=A0ABW5D6Z8_9BACT